MTALFAVVVLASLCLPVHAHQAPSWRPRRTRACCSASTKAPQYANLDYIDAYGEQIDEVFALVPGDRHALHRQRHATVPTSGFAGMVLKPWDERKRTRQGAAAAWSRASSAGDHGHAGLRLLAAAAAGHNRRPAGADGRSARPASFETVFKVMEQLKEAARKSGMFIVTDSDLEFNNPVVRVNIDRSKANDLGITMADDRRRRWRRMVGGNYINRFNLEGRSYEVIPQVPRDAAPDAASSSASTTSRRAAASRCRSRPWSRSTARHRAQRADPVQPAQLGHLLGGADARRHHGPGGGLPASSRRPKILPRRLPPRLPLASRASTSQEGNQLTVTFVFALIIIFLVLAAQFEILRDPLVILVSVPMSICGALLPLFFGLATLNIYTQIGLVTLIGLISKHGILMVEFANELQRDESLDRRAAIERAAQVRLRPDPDDHGGDGGGPDPAARRHRAPVPRAGSRSASSSSPACRSARCSRCSCCRPSTPCWPPTTARHGGPSARPSCGASRRSRRKRLPVPGRAGEPCGASPVAA